MSARPSLALAASLATSFALAACTDTGVIAFQDATNSADTFEIRAALNGHVTPVTVLHNPFPGLTDRQVAEIVASETPGRMLGDARFTGDPSQANSAPYRLVWDFGTNGASGGDGGCNSPLAPGAAGPVGAGPTNVHGSISLCRAGGPLTRAYGYIDQVAGPADGRFGSFVSRMSAEILLYPMPAGGAGGSDSSRP
jgi:hypothetical protein